PCGGGTCSPRLWGITVGPDGNLWFTESLANKIGHVATGVHLSGIMNLGWRCIAVVCQGGLTGDLDLWSLRGASVRSATLLATGLPVEWQITAIGDLDGNGTRDLLWRHSQTGDVAAWLMTGVSVTAIPVISSGVPLWWQTAGLGDLNGDGKADIIWRNTQTGDVAVWFMEGATVLQYPVVSPGVPLSWRIVKVADADGDGKADLVWRHDAPTTSAEIVNGEVAVWLMDGTTVTQTTV